MKNKEKYQENSVQSKKLQTTLMIVTSTIKTLCFWIINDEIIN